MSDSNELIQQRIQKIEELKKQGINPYPVRFFPDSKSKDIVEKFEKDPTGPETKFKLGGRLHSKRVMGKASFAHLKDSAGIIQLYATRDDLGETSYAIFKSLDLVDIVGLEGYLFKTQKGEVT
ncbi:OB-fold nucleic acid binding domain-containing protein, partial [Leptospira santarosai]|uniref:OB-fold nucleic acid binding domain-containing protein n=1 Tax=Leptospira santarosai TaxID=28183 RepID=UPI00403650D7